MGKGLRRFLGDSPLRVLIKLVIFSVIVGVVMRALNWSPHTLYNGLIQFFKGIWDLGFDAFYNGLEYFVLGAVVVVPLFFIIRVLNFRKPH